VRTLSAGLFRAFAAAQPPAGEIVHEGVWQAAIECLILVAEKNGPTMMARIGMMKAPCRGRVRVSPGIHR